MLLRIALITVLIMCSSAANIHADEVSTTIERALKEYNDGKYVDAAGSLDQASQLIRQKRAGDLEVLLPEPLPGWTATTPSSQTVSTAFLGGGVFCERTYSKGYDSSVLIKIMTDSPMIQSIMMMLTNPMVVNASGGRLISVNGNQAIIKYNPQTGRGDINIVVDNRFLITVNGIMVDEGDMTTYAENINYEGLRALP